MSNAQVQVKKGGTTFFSFKSPSNPFVNIAKERTFLIVITVAFMLAGFFYQNFQVAMWLGFAFAAYSAIANDSIQTIGTFIGSNTNRPWWVLWLFIAGIFLITVLFSWVVFEGDVSFGRLNSKDKETGDLLFPQPQDFYFLQVAAPLILLIITRLKMPVSTTFLLLSAFSAKADGIEKMLLKSFSGYVIAFVVAIVIYVALNGVIRKYFSQRKPRSWWVVAQWITSGTLWSVWIMQDAANIAVFLPRQLNTIEFTAFAGFVVIGLGILFWLKGDKIQQIVSEKTQITDVRAATLVDFVYSGIMVYKLFASTVPMSTTWVFLGLLGGREIAINIMRQKSGSRHRKKAVKMVLKDMLYAFIGLVVSILLAMGVNKAIRDEILSYFI